MIRQWVARLLFVVLAGLLSAGVARADMSVRTYGNGYVDDWIVTAGGSEAACAQAGYVRWRNYPNDGGYLRRLYTSYTGAGAGWTCLVYSDLARTQYLHTWQVMAATTQTSGLTFWDGWCNSAESCAAQGYTSSGGAGGTSSVSVTVEPAPASAENIADYNTLYAAFLAGIVSIYLVKRLGALWSSDHERG